LVKKRATKKKELSLWEKYPVILQHKKIKRGINKKKKRGGQRHYRRSAITTGEEGLLHLREKKFLWEVLRGGGSKLKKAFVRQREHQISRRERF